MPGFGTTDRRRRVGPVLGAGLLTLAPVLVMLGAMILAQILAQFLPQSALATELPAAVPDPTLDAGRPSPDRGGPPALFRQELAAPDTLGVGRVASNVAEQLPAVEALAEALRPHLGSLGYSRALPVIARDNAEMIEFLREGIVDVVSETPLPAIHFVHRAGATILLRERRNGRATYSAVVFTRSDSPIRMLSDLRGHRIAFADRASTAAFLLPLAALRRANIPIQLVASPTNEVRKEAVGFFFARSRESILSAVTRRAAEAGAISDDDWRSIHKEQTDVAAVLRPVHVSEEVPRAFVVVSPKMSKQQRDELRHVLEAFERDAAGRATLERYGDVQGFDAIDDELEHQIYNLQITYELVSSEMG